MEVSIILPVHNEASVLERNIASLKRSLDGSIGEYEIIISEDGSTDDTVKVAKTLECESVRVLHHGKRNGKGAAIKKAANIARSNIILFMDADLASNPEQVKELMESIKDGASLVIGSRYLKASKTRRDPVRYIASRGFNILVRTFTGSKLSDHQCGFKAFRKDLVLPLINEVEDRGWFWDTEMLVRAQRRRLKIVERPIEWREADGSKFRLMRDSLRMLRSLINFKLKNG